MHVTVWSVKFLAPGAQPTVALLRRLGYRAALRVIANAVPTPESMTRAQAGMHYGVSRRGTRTPDPIITSASDVSLVGVSGDQFAVTSAELGSGWDGAGQAKRPKNAPRKLGTPRAVTAPLRLAEEEAAGVSRFRRAAGDPRTDDF
jgi:hypothetical protein